METDEELLSKNVISSASAEGLFVQVNGTEELRPWDRVTAASATIVEHAGARIFVLAIVFDDVRAFVLGEIEPAWQQVIELLHIHLPGVEPFSSWGPQLLENPAVMDLFEREA